MTIFNLDTLIAISILILSLFIFLNLNYKNNAVKFLFGYVDFFLIFSSKLDEKNKIKNLKKQLNIIIKNFIIFILKLTITLTPVLLTIFFELFIKKINFIGIFFSTGFILLSAIIFIIFYKFKKKKFKRYDQTNELIHKLTIQNFPLLKLTFDCEKKFFLKKNRFIKKLFITGYARSGTTHLLNELYKSNQFSSLKYSNLPLILSPKINNIFIKFFANQKNNNSYSRAHSDGLNISYSSPEAFEEIFWKFISSNSYIKKDFLKKHDLSNFDLEEFNKYISLITEKDKIYLSKNNNNILRIKDLSNIENSIFLIMFRSPLEHSNSLLKQHNNFVNLQQRETFIKDYMSSIGHYEFGQNHKPFFYNDNEYKSETINYWIKEWIKFYNEILNTSKKNNFYFISYDKCCSEKNYINLKLNKILNYDFNINFESKKKNKSYKTENNLNYDILQKANEIHQILLKKN